MAKSDSLPGTTAGLTHFARRVWLTVHPPAVPDTASPPELSPEERRLLRLDRVRAMLEQARAVLERDGFVRGAWFAVPSPSGGTRLVNYPEALALRDPRAKVRSACLIGTLVRLADDPDTAPSVADAWGCVEELYEAMHERLGHRSRPGGRVSAPTERRRHVQALTNWNDTAGRTTDDLLDLVDRAISRTIVAACRT